MDHSAHRSRRWRITRAEVQKTVLIPAPEWHPLDGTTAPEHIPDQWNGPHCGLRLVDAFKTLANLPNSTSIGASGFWPSYLYEWEDLLAQRTADETAQEDDANARNRARTRPSAQQISHMELAISWAGRYVLDVDIARTVQRVALARSRDLDMRHLAWKLKQNQDHLRHQNETGLDMIAAGLRRDEARVF
jgi:hypothetical protein